MTVTIKKNSDNDIVISNEVGNIRFSKVGTVETYDTVSYPDGSIGKLISFKKNKIYTLPILRVAMSGSTSPQSVTFGFDGYSNGSGIALNFPYSDDMKRIFTQIPFKVRAIRCTTIQSTKMDATERSNFLNGNNLTSPIIKHVQEDIMAGTMTTAPIANFSTKPTTTKDRFTITFQNASASVFTYYEFVMDFLYEN